MSNEQTPPIPSRYRASCELCNHELDIRADGVHQWTSGWVMQRAGGGGHAIALPQRANRWAHRWCVERACAGHTGQLGMFETPTPSLPLQPAPAPPRDSNAHIDEQGRLIHDKCAVCDAPARFGVGVSLLKGHLGMWFCAAHRPQTSLAT